MIKLKLNPDCIRDLLLTVEDHTDMTHWIEIDFNREKGEDPDLGRLDKYSSDEQMYHVKQCELSGFFFKVDWFLGGSCAISYLSPKGHEFLENIRADTNWNKVKQTAKNVGSESLSVLAQIAGQVIAAMLAQPH